MTDEKIKEMVLELLDHVDYDISKSFNAEISEDPEYAEEEMSVLVEIVKENLV